MVKSEKLLALEEMKRLASKHVPFFVYHIDLEIIRETRRINEKETKRRAKLKNFKK